MSTTIQVTREYIPDAPKTYCIVVDPPVAEGELEGAIADKLLSTSLSSPNIGSYTISIDHPSQSNAVTVHHNRSSHDRFTDVNARFRLLEEEVKGLKKEYARKEEEYARKEEERARIEEEHAQKEEATLKWEVYSRLAQAINDSTLATWSDSASTLLKALHKALRAKRLQFLPYTLTAEALLWQHENHDQDLEPAIPALDLYSTSDRARYLKAARKNREIGQEIIDQAWIKFDPLDLKLMLTAWAERDPSRNNSVHMMPSVTFATDVLATDSYCAGTMGTRAKEMIMNGVNLQGERVFADF